MAQENEQNERHEGDETKGVPRMRQHRFRRGDPYEYKIVHILTSPETGAHQLVEYMNCRFRGGDNTCICGFRTRDIYGFEGLNTYLCEVGSTAKVNKVGLQEGSGVHRGVSIFF